MTRTSFDRSRNFFTSISQRKYFSIPSLRFRFPISLLGNNTNIIPCPSSLLGCWIRICIVYSDINQYIALYRSIDRRRCFPKKWWWFFRLCCCCKKLINKFVIFSFVAKMKWRNKMWKIVMIILYEMKCVNGMDAMQHICWFGWTDR